MFAMQVCLIRALSDFIIDTIFLQEAEDGTSVSSMSRRTITDSMYRDAMAPSLLVSSAPEQRNPTPASMTTARARQGHRYFAKVSVDWSKGFGSLKIPSILRRR